MATVTLIVRLTAKRGKFRDLVKAAKPLAALVRKQPGCLTYDLHVSTEENDTLYLHEVWRDRKSFNAHHTVDRIIALADIRDRFVATDTGGITRSLR